MADLTLESPPVLPDGSSGPGAQSLLPMVGVGVSMTMMLFFRGSSFAALGAVVLVASLLGAVLFFVSTRGKGVRRRRQQRALYLDYLERVRDRGRADEESWRSAAVVAQPAAAGLLDVVRSPARLWERRRADDDVLAVRLGTGLAAQRRVVLDDASTSVSPADPFMVAEARAVARRYQNTGDAPLVVPLDRAGDVSVLGDRDDVCRVGRLVLGQAAALHAPDDLAVAVICPPERVADWAWARWLPHAGVPGPIGAAGPQALFAATPADLAELLGADLAERAAAAAASQRRGGGRDESATRPRLLVLDDCWGEVAGDLALPDPALGLADLGITVVHLCRDQLDEPGEISARVRVDGPRVQVESAGGTSAGWLDPWTAPEAEALARELSPLRLSRDSYDDGTGTAPADFADLLDLDPSAALDLARRWEPRSDRDFLRVPIGVSPEGRPVLLDLKESSQLGMGPHGMCIGAIGSGKSELLRTLLLALVLSHPPEQLSLVLIDYKGGAAFAPFTRIPHVAGLITNLAADEALIDRAYASLDGEVRRRQQLLADIGGAVDVTEYDLRRAADPDRYEPLPRLLVVIDEFAELVTAKPEFADLLLRIGRIGRSIGVHLLLSSQRVEAGKLKGLDTYLSYRLGLRTFSELESRTVIDSPDAFHLPAVPGVGYLKVDVSIYTRFKTAYVSGPVQTAAEPAPSTAPAGTVRPLPDYGRPRAAEGTDVVPEATTRGLDRSLLETLLDSVTGARPPVRPVWLPPLPSALSLGDAVEGWHVTSDGVRLRYPSDPDRLVLPLGRLDDPGRQWQGTWTADLDDAAGHLLVLGGPGSGTTTALSSLVLAVATTRSPTETIVHGIDLQGSGLRRLRGLPHVGSIAGRDDTERIRRTIEQLHDELAEREALFREHRLDSLAEVRAAHRAGRLPQLPAADVVLAVDGWAALMAAVEDLHPQLGDLLTRGGRAGIHVVATARRWNELRIAQQNSFGARIELRLTDPTESSVDPRAARTVPVHAPGRGLTTDSRSGQVALPLLAPAAAPGAADLSAVVALVQDTWTGPLAPPIRVLPAVVPAADLPAPPQPWRVPLGRRERDHAVVHWDPGAADGHLLVLGDSGSGKTNLLRHVMTSLAARHGADDVVFAVFDPRRSLQGLLPDAYEGGYADTVGRAHDLTAAVGKELEARAGAAGGAATGPRIVVVVDDYDVLAASGTHPLAGFVPHLASARELRWHVVLTRRVLGAARGLYDPVVLGVRESGGAMLVMSGEPSEGQLLPGIRPRPLPAGRGQYIRAGRPAVVLQTPLHAAAPPAVDPEELP